MPVFKAFLIIVFYFLICVSGIWCLRLLPTYAGIQAETLCWLWMAIYALFLPNRLALTAEHFKLTRNNLIFLSASMALVPLMQCNTSEYSTFAAFTFVISLLFGPAVCEELLFRARFDELSSRLDHPFWILILNGFIFTASHVFLRGFGILQILTFLPGILLWLVYKRTRNLLTVISLHWLFNATFYAVFCNLG